ncbi:MAG TPA: AMP-binding protein, partial [Myxococcota bacterium]|nr:AMP-binding protein [Myxococcota bacterium]
MARTTILDLFVENAEQHATKVAALEKRAGRYEERTWKQLYDEAMRASAGLLAQGVKGGDRVHIVSNTRLEWVILDMAILHAGGITVPVYPSSLAEECGYIAQNSGAVLAFVEDEKQTEKMLAERKNMPDLRRIVQMTGNVSANADGWVITYDAFIKQGGDVEKVKTELDARRKALKKESPFTLIYTSGTTGKPKGVVLTHDAMAYEAEAVQA